MKRGFRKALAFMLAVVLFSSMIADAGKTSIFAQADEEDGCMYEGTVLTYVPYDAESVKVKEGTTEIGERAFYGRSELVDVEIPDTVKVIGKEAFARTEKLQTVKLPTGLKSIGESAFERSGIVSIELPKGITEIPKSVFWWAENLETVSMKGKITKIDNSAFAFAKKLKAISLPKGLTYIGSSAFADCPFDSLTIPSTVTFIGDDAFRGIPGKITVQSGSKSFKMYKNGLYTSDFKRLIAYPKDAEEIVFHPKCTQYDWLIFNGSEAKSLTLSDKIEKIERYDFRDCVKLEKVVIGSGLKEFSVSAFYNCESLKEIDVNNKNKMFSSYKGALYSKDKSVIIYFPEGLNQVELHKKTTSFANNSISGGYYNTMILCSDNMEGFSQLKIDFLDKEDAITFKAKAGSKTAANLAKCRDRFNYVLDRDYSEIIKMVSQGESKINIKVGTVAEPDYNLAGLYQVDKFGDEDNTCIIKWSSSDKTVAEVDKDGLIWGVKPGTATVKAVIKFKNGKKKTLEYTVKVKKGKIAKGDLVRLGTYEQDNNKKNGAEPIYWVAIDANKKAVFLLSRDVIEYQNRENNVSWENSALRTWLNSEFYDSAFSKSEKEKIRTATLANSLFENEKQLTEQKKTKDKVFILSFEEVTNEDYGFCTEYEYPPKSVYESRVCGASEYVLVQDKYRDFVDSGYYAADGKKAFPWCLRNERRTSFYVRVDGSLYTWGGLYELLGVRPAMYINQN